MIQWVKELGLPVSAALALAVGIYRAARWLAPRAEGWINRIIASHEKMVDDTTETNRQNAETLKQMAVTQAQLTTVQAAQTTLLHRVETYIVGQEKGKHARPEIVREQAG